MSKVREIVEQCIAGIGGALIVGGVTGLISVRAKYWPIDHLGDWGLIAAGSMLLLVLVVYYVRELILRNQER